jgi:hypothetical protein
MGDPFAQVPQRVWTRLIAPGTPPMLLRVYMVHRGRGDFAQRISVVSVGAVARELGTIDSRVAAAERELEAMGFIKRVFVSPQLRRIVFADSPEFEPAPQPDPDKTAKAAMARIKEIIR